MDGTRDYLFKKSEVNQQDKYHLYMESKKYDTNELIYKGKIESQTQKTNTVTKGESGGEGKDKSG